MSAGIVMVLIGCVSLAFGAISLIFWIATWPRRHNEFVRRLKGNTECSDAELKNLTIRQIKVTIRRIFTKRADRCVIL